MTEMGLRQTGQIHKDFHFQVEDADMSLVLQPPCKLSQQQWQQFFWLSCNSQLSDTGLSAKSEKHGWRQTGWSDQTLGPTSATATQRSSREGKEKLKLEQNGAMSELTIFKNPHCHGVIHPLVLPQGPHSPVPQFLLHKTFNFFEESLYSSVGGFSSFNSSTEVWGWCPWKHSNRDPSCSAMTSLEHHTF